jgi:hypothetical protein
VRARLSWGQRAVGRTPLPGGPPRGRATDAQRKALIRADAATVCRGEYSFSASPASGGTEHAACERVRAARNRRTDGSCAGQHTVGGLHLPIRAPVRDRLRAPGSQCGPRQSRQFANLSDEALSFSTQQILLDLAAAGQRELVDEEDAARDLEAGDATAAEVDDLLLGGGLRRRVDCYRNCYRKIARRAPTATFELIIRSSWVGCGSNAEGGTRISASHAVACLCI